MKVKVLEPSEIDARDTGRLRLHDPIVPLYLL